MINLLSIFNFRVRGGQSQYLSNQALETALDLFSRRASGQGFFLIDVMIGLFVTVILMTLIALSGAQVWRIFSVAHRELQACRVGCSALERSFARPQSGHYSTVDSGYRVDVDVIHDQRFKNMLRIHARVHDVNDVTSGAKSIACVEFDTGICV